MRRLKDVPPTEMPEVLRVASELYAQDRADIERAEESQELKKAAEEVDLPAEYLERAAAVVHAEKAAHVRDTRRRRTSVLVVLGVALGLWGGWRVTHPPPPQPVSYTFNAPASGQWMLDTNPESRASVTFDSRAGLGGAVVTVERFGAQSDGRFFVNLDSAQVPPTLAGYNTVTFRARSSGLPNVRLYLEAGATERWRSPPVPLSADRQVHQLRLDQFDHQTRNSSADNWRTTGYRPPGRIERLSFKLGHFVNPPEARGSVTIDELRFE